MGILEWAAMNAPLFEIATALALTTLTGVLVWIELRRGRPVLQLRFVVPRDTLDASGRSATVFFRVANKGGTGGVIDPERSGLRLRLPDGWKKAGLEIFTQEQYLVVEGLHKGHHVTPTPLSREDVDTMIEAGRLKAYVGRYHPPKGFKGPCDAVLEIGAVTGRKTRKKFQAQ